MFSIFAPNINPEIVHIGNLSLRWYSLAYIAGFICSYYYIQFLTKKTNYFAFFRLNLKTKFFDDVVFYAALGVVLGGRIGYVLFYNLNYYFHNPLKIFYVWEGGMSFHGGLLGVLIACFFLSRKNKIGFFSITDLLAPSVPLGLFFGRLANFINQELYGRITTLPWGVIFKGQIYPRHPSQLYEAFLEGLVLFLILGYLFLKKHYYKTPSLISGIFLVGYGLFRSFAEIFREPDIQIGFLFKYLTEGQILSFIMIIFGLIIIFFAKTQKPKNEPLK